MRVLYFLSLFTITLALKLPEVQKRPVRSSITTYPNGTPCSNETSTAWVNIILLVDTSTHMGSSRLRQLGLSLSSELSKYTFGNIDQAFTSRVALISYASQATVVGDLYEFDSYSSISSALLDLKVSNTTSAAGINDALSTATQWVEDIQYENVTWREPIIIIFAASLEGVDTDLLQLYAMEDGAQNLATVNFIENDRNATTILNTISSKSWNFTGTDKNVYKDLDWAITQANCFCGGAQLAAIDHHTKRFTRYADCYSLDDWFGFWDNQTFTELCSDSYPLAINSEFKSEFIQSRHSPEDKRTILDDDQYFNAFGYGGIYLGLHRNAKNEWVWLDYDGSEVPLGNYTNWAKGYNSSSPGDCVIANDHQDGKPWYWRTASCYPTKENVCSTACASLACDATFGMLEDSKCGFGDFFLKARDEGKNIKKNIFKNRRLNHQKL